MTGKTSDQPAFMNQMAMKAAGFEPGAEVRIVPETTAFDLPIWTIQEKGVVVSLGTKRIKVRLEGGAIYAVSPGDLQLLDTVNPKREEQTGMPNYRVSKQKTYFAVVRQGPKGGFRTVAVYKMEHQANDVATKLNQWARQEV